MSNQASLRDISGSKSSSDSRDEENQEWKEDKLGELAIYQNGNSFSKSQWSDEGYPIIRIQNLTGEQEEFNHFDGDLDEKYRVKDGDILLAWSGTIDLFQWEGEDAALNQHIYRVDTEDGINDIFFQFKLEEVIPRLIALSHGSTMKHVRKADLVNLDVEIPSDIDEQRRIASVLYNVDQAISKTEEIIEQTQRVKKGLMQDFFTEGYYSHEEYQETRLGKIPANWNMIPAKELCEEITVGIVSGSTDHYCGKEGVPFVRNQDINPTGIEAEEPKFISKEFHEQNKKSELREGDVVTVRTGQPGTSCVVGKEYEGANSFSTIISRPKDSTNEKYYSKFVNSDKALQFIDSWKAGGVQDNFNIGVMRKLPVPYPPEDEQEKIVESVEAVQEKIQNHKEEKEQLQRLKKGLMQDLLTGSVRTGEDVRVLDEVVEVEA